MNKKAIKVLEYEKIIELLSNQAGSEMTQRVISELKPFTDPRIVKTALAETLEASSLITFKGPLPLGNFYDIGGFLSFAKKGGSLNMKQLLQVHYNLRVASDVKTYLRGDIPDLPILRSIEEVIAVFKDLEEEIDRCIESEDYMSDNASSELKSIRRNIMRQNDAIKNRINQMINSADNKTLLQDAIVTVRDGRYVIPVKQEHRGKFPGIVHDQSSSGATLFIEPQVIVNLNNELRELEIAEKVEIERILAELSSRVGEHEKPLLNNQELLLQLDLIMAKGKLAHLQRAECPKVNDEGILILKEARHPLIDRQKAVPINIELGEGYDTLVVTGPNTGGKTVSLKTAGLLSMMAQTGLHIPASEMSTIPVYENIFADIGDEQSIEQSLSTFSSHMTNIVEIVGNAYRGSLVLLDELGAGTDPTEGAALAIAILETLRANGASILATTHYTELKKYALKTDRVQNASMEFDVETLSPTYKLTIGVPGKSNAFEISKKLGLPGQIIDKSRSLLEGGDIQFEEVLEAIEEDKKQAEVERDEAITLNIQMKKQKEEIDKREKKLKAQQEKLLNDAKEEARAILAEAKEVSKSVQEELRQLAKIESLGERNARLDRSKRKIKDAAGRYKETITKEENDNPVSIEDVQIGDRVKVLTLNQNGEVIALPDSKGEIMVQVGIMKVKSKPADLKMINDSTKKKKKPQVKVTGAGALKSKAMQVSTTLNVQGNNLDDAIEKVAKYLDDAYIAHLKEVTIIHGRGEGILKKGIRDYLKQSKQVESFKRGTYSEGGDGVTLVTLK